MSEKVAKYCPSCQAPLLPGSTRCRCGWSEVGRQAKRKEPVGLDCAAYGCHLAGSRQGGGGAWYCTWHYGEEVSTFDAITTWIRQHREQIGELQYLGNHYLPERYLNHIDGETPIQTVRRGEARRIELRAQLRDSMRKVVGKVVTGMVR